MNENVLKFYEAVSADGALIPKAAGWHHPHEVGNDRIFGTLTVVSYLLERIAPGTGWRTRLLERVLALTPSNQECMGFTGNWRECPFWEPYLPRL